MKRIELDFKLSDSDKEVIKEAVHEIIHEAISDFGRTQQDEITFYSSEEACKLLNCSKSTLSRWRDKGYIQGIQIGGNYMYSKRAIERSIAIGLKYKH